MTLKEFALYQRGFSQKVDREMHQLAWVTAHLLNAWRSKGPKITVSKLHPKSGLAKAQTSAPLSPEEAKDRVRERRAQAEQQELWGNQKGERVKDWLGLEG